MQIILLRKRDGTDVYNIYCEIHFRDTFGYNWRINRRLLSGMKNSTFFNADKEREYFELKRAFISYDLKALSPKIITILNDSCSSRHFILSRFRSEGTNQPVPGIDLYYYQGKISDLILTEMFFQFIMNGITVLFSGHMGE